MCTHILTGSNKGKSSGGEGVQQGGTLNATVEQCRPAIVLSVRKALIKASLWR